MWRLAKQFLPTNDARHHRRMVDNNCCQFCGGKGNWRHTLIWALADREVTEHMLCSEEGDAREWLAIMIETLKQDNQTRVFVTLWAIWHARRKAVHEQVYQSPLSIHYFVENFIADLNLTVKPKKVHPTTARGRDAWILPPPGLMKINVDAAVGKHYPRGAVAAIARNAQGMFMGASAVTIPDKADAEMLEILACREAIALAKDINVQSVRVASDCLNAVRSIQQGTLGASALIIVKEIDDSSLGFDTPEFIHEGRHSNVEAHGA
jgi:hypothetical protein